MARIIKCTQAINEALHQAMSLDTRVICFGLGVPDPKGVFGTTLGLQQRFGAERVFDMPASENGMTGVAIGASLAGLRPVMTHQRVDFFLLAMDQLVNSAAKWSYTFAGKAHVPITIRLIIGRGWGQGPTHSQSLQSWFAHIPGLKVVMPALASDAKGLLLSSIFDNNPVVFLEHRWLHNLEGDVPEGDVRIPLGKANILREGADVTIVSMSYMTIEALTAVDHLMQHGVTCDLVDLRSISPIDWDTIHKSVRKTGRLLVTDTEWPVCSVSSEIVAGCALDLWGFFKTAPERIAPPHFPVPASRFLAAEFYPGAVEIVQGVEKMLGRDCRSMDLKARRTGPNDTPGDYFRGPF